MRTYRHWTKDELAFLTANYGPKAAKEIATILNRTHMSVMKKVCEIGATKHKWQKVVACEHLTDAQLGWLAGIFDGEGHFGWQRDKHCSAIQVTNTSLRMLETIKLLVGGAIYPVKQRERCKPCWQWCIQRRASVISIVKAVFPYLVAKKELASSFLENIGASKENFYF